jgi:hypothetical protein
MEAMAAFDHKNVYVIVIIYACKKGPLVSSFFKFVGVLAFMLQRVALCWRKRVGVPVYCNTLFKLSGWSCEVPKLQGSLTIPMANGIAMPLLQCWNPFS